MREIEFLPEWYPQLRRRQRRTKLQGLLTLGLIAALAGWYFFVSRNVEFRAHANTELESQLERTRRDLSLLDQKLEEMRRLESQERVLARVGADIDITRLLAELETLMPKEMFLIDVSIETQEQTGKVRTVDGSASELNSGASKLGLIDRRMRVKLMGVAPGDGDVATLLAGLTSKPYLERVGMNYAKDRIENGHRMREFEVTFTINLNSQSNGGA